MVGVHGAEMSDEGLNIPTTGFTGTDQRLLP
jgi:hypothetical protein